MIGLLAQAVDQYGGNVTELPNTGFPLLPVLVLGFILVILGFILMPRK